MTVKAADTLVATKPSASLSAFWRGLDLDGVADLVASAAQLEGHLLPAIRYEGSLVFPVVRMHHEAVTFRQDRQIGPILERRLLRDLARSRPASQPPPAVAMSGFLTVDRLASVRSTLGRLAGWARVVAAVPAWTRLPDLQATACDYYGYTVASTDGEDAEVLITGHEGPRPGASTARDPWQLRWEEMLFDLAIKAGAVRWP